MASIGWSGAVGRLNGTSRSKLAEVCLRVNMTVFEIDRIRGGTQIVPDARAAGLAMWAGDVVL